MKLSKLLAPTLRENPAEAEVVSHQLLMRAGYIRRLANGVYNYLPLMWRVLRKVEQIVREEMDRAGAQELLMPILQPAEVWQASGRWDIYGPLMMRVKDRHDREYGLAPTAEEVITDIATKEIRSYRQLPVNLYQIQTKYRDEIRPRFGLLRGREFIMKDAYSFHANQDCMDAEYDNMAETYTRIFNRCGLETRQVRSDSGTIGGSVSHEYMVLTRIAEGEQESGENDVFYCEQCDYAANAERAESLLGQSSQKSVYAKTEVVETPGATSLEIMHRQFKMHPELILKSLIYIADEKTPVMALIRGDYDVEETKLLNAVCANELRMASGEEIDKLTGGSAKGFIGPIGLPKGIKPEEIKIIADASVKDMKDFYVAVNQVDKHLVNANWGADLALPETVVDIRLARVGDTCPECKQGALAMTRGIEVGNIFQLGTKYSSSMNATYTAEDGTEQPFIMGCYGIGVTRTAAAAIERFHDKDGIVWPMGLAPFKVIVVPVNITDETQNSLASRIYQMLQDNGIEVLMDDRDERAGVKFKDADLIGIPIRITAGKKAADGLLEVKLRDSREARDLKESEILAFVKDNIANWHPQLEAKNLSPVK
ncbi:MAG: proline--tRNA ligase [Vampirovibrionales bacterium]|nr:proline--tRNA ligase [Vampirovibrionales bacterium]